MQSMRRFGRQRSHNAHLLRQHVLHNGVWAYGEPHHKTRRGGTAETRGRSWHRNHSSTCTPRPHDRTAAYRRQRRVAAGAVVCAIDVDVVRHVFLPPVSHQLLRIWDGDVHGAVCSFPLTLALACWQATWTHTHTHVCAHSAARYEDARAAHPCTTGGGVDYGWLAGAGLAAQGVRCGGVTAYGLTLAALKNHQAMRQHSRGSAAREVLRRMPCARTRVHCRQGVLAGVYRGYCRQASLSHLRRTQLGVS